MNSRHKFPHPIITVALVLILWFGILGRVNSADDDYEATEATDASTEDPDAADAPEAAQSTEPTNPAAVQILSQLIFTQFSNMSTFLSPDIRAKLDFCIKNVEAEWNLAFNFSADSEFLSNCIQKTKGEAMQRICTSAEIRFYFRSFLDSGSKKYLKPNMNCNLSSWVPGCEPGWSCSVGKDKKVDFKNSKDVPSRILASQPCCEGFFCPQGITCMIPCPLGAYCPLATLNKTSGVCDPYHYQTPQGQTNHTCGGADMWADILSSRPVFCSAGSYCPTTIKRVPCSRGHYCRTGSTTQTRCFRLATCEEKTENQNITAYGILLFVGLMLVMLIMYNCSDQVLSTREKNKEKSREAAARSAKETAQARERWKTAKDAAKKGASGLQTSLSRTFSRKRSSNSQDFKGTGQVKSGSDVPANASQAKGTRKEDSDFHDIDEDPDNHEGFNMQIGNKNMKKPPKGKELHSRSSIFRYAYGQIEKEKALQEQHKNLSFSGIISMASDGEPNNRPTIEVEFKDLTLTLKGTNRHIMRCVSGKIMPGRVSAVMGPSGAGKTTFLSALAGKATGCTRSGQILINGKPDSIHCYKKIVGFVPQDDIVHGNLTVEENLWFSAKCRLPAELPKMEKVLVVERVIESLGLQSVRDSMVGSVEKRGISGGQRKRVNVGLEMVMEPSLLILDEPTSGLDSSSSQLLLRALRREAQEGVNISMVVHQPSYTLFQMFDDLILLAKGGLTAYHGPVKKVEEYFEGLGITVPERINPPDHFIDILEGIVKPTAASGINFKELPLRWMLHNGYAVPQDMLNTAGGLKSSASGNDSAHGGMISSAASESLSFVGEILKDLRFHAELKIDFILHNFLRSADLSNRNTPNVFEQYRQFLGRIGKQRMREAMIQAIDLLILLLAGICLGTLAKVSDETFGATGYTYTVIAVSLLTGIAALRSFSLDKLHYWRESASGMSSLAYFMAKDTVDLLNTILKPMVYLSMFYFFNNPRSSFLDNYIVLVCLVYCVTGIAYAFAIYLQPGPAQLWSVLVPVVLTLIANQTNPGDFLKSLQDICYTKWALEAFVVANVEKYSGVWLVTRCGSLMSSNYKLDDWFPCLIYLIIAGIVSRTVAYFCLVTFQKK
ncbi:ABC transporter G family member 28-like [Impatiens glandulifera]|uniref:ABC transporter G family member 28-like n=1 Tax=Impatiens glandulifera TaxID=253017 RepID=UPI001FB0DCC6|nr:ABC transporter G family member 28-like [Impatiens glandulifera]